MSVLHLMKLLIRPWRWCHAMLRTRSIKCLLLLLLLLLSPILLMLVLLLLSHVHAVVLLIVLLMGSTGRTEAWHIGHLLMLRMLLGSLTRMRRSLIAMWRKG